MAPAEKNANLLNILLNIKVVWTKEKPPDSPQTAESSGFSLVRVARVELTAS